MCFAFILNTDVKVYESGGGEGLLGDVCHLESACSVGAAHVAAPSPHGGDSVC